MLVDCVIAASRGAMPPHSRILGERQVAGIDVVDRE
jgi:hypothetical protein